MRVKPMLTDPDNILSDINLMPAYGGWVASGGIYYYATGNIMNQLTASSLSSGMVLYPNGIILPISLESESSGKSASLKIIVEVVQSEHLPGNTIADVAAILGEGEESQISLNLNGGTATTPLSVVMGTGNNEGKFKIQGSVPNVPASMPTAEFYFFSDMQVTNNTVYFNNMNNLTRYDLNCWYDTPVTEISLYATYLVPNLTLDENGMMDSSSSSQSSAKTGDVLMGGSPPPTYNTYVIANGPTKIEGTWDGYFTPLKDFTNGANNYSHVVLPSSITTIGVAAFYKSNKLSRVSVSDNVTSIGMAAFAECTSLTKFKFPNKLQHIHGDMDTPFTFANTGLTEIIIPESYTFIEAFAFAWCTNVDYVYIPNTVTQIQPFAFTGCTSLESIDIPSSVTSISFVNALFVVGGPFFGCDALQAINVDSNNLNYSSVDGILFDNSQTSILSYPKGKTETTYSIPLGVTEIGNFAFVECQSLTSITIPESVITFGEHVFANCTSLSSIYCEHTDEVMEEVIEHGYIAQYALYGIPYGAIIYFKSPILMDIITQGYHYESGKGITKDFYEDF